ncbi:MAG: hypothetical protein WDN24_14595 [Sphingomonas sp.]
MNKTFLSGALILVLTVAVLAWFAKGIPAALPLAPDMAVAASKVVACLVVVALLLERALAAFNDLLFGRERSEARQQLAAAHAPPPAGAAAAPALAPALRALEQIDGKRERARLLMGLAAGFVISAAGIRTIAGLVTGQQALTGFQTIVDICLTAGLLAGGSNGLSKLVDVLQEGAGQRLNALRRNA